MKVNIAGAPFEISEKTIKGSFHPLPLSLWRAIVGFQRIIAIRHEAESITLHRWHKGEGRYHTIIPHQETRKRGLVVNYNPARSENVQLLDEYGRKYKEDFANGMLTIHSHVDATAFESGADAYDEHSLPGWHITIGHMLTWKEYHLDFRMRLPHIPKITKLTDTSICYKIEHQNIFGKGVKRDDVYKCPGSMTWEKYLTRVTLR